MSGPIRAQPQMIGREIAGRFRILAKIGEGGMGAVYRAEQISLKRAVAVKVLRPELSANQMLVRRFETEAAAVAKIDHPNTVKVYDFGQDTDGSLFIAMEYIEGRSLRAAVQQGPMPPARALGIAIQVAASLADAHTQSIVHRDLKPDNVMLIDKGRSRDIVRVLDFGIARDDSRSTQLAMTQAGDMLGTPQYMAPEQIRGETIDGRTDVYALGCLIYEMVTARLPFEAPTVLAMLTKHLTEQVPAPSVRRPDLGIPPAIDHLVLAAMAKDPNARPPTMDDYGELLTTVLQSLPADPSRVASVGMPAVGALPVTPVPYAQPHAMTPPVQTPAPIQRIPPTTRTVPQLPAKPSRASIYAVVGVLAIGGVGAGIWAATRGGPKAPAPQAITAAGSGSAIADTHVAAGGDHDIPVTTTEDLWGGGPAAPEPTPVPAHSPRPAHATTTTTTTSPSEIGTAEKPIPPGVQLSMPAGFTRVPDPKTIAYVDSTRGILIAIAPLDGGTNDPAALGARWVHDNAQYKIAPVTSSTLAVHGVNRPLLAFTATINNVAASQLLLLFITPSYRLGFFVQAPSTLFAQQTFQSWVGDYINNGITLP